MARVEIGKVRHRIVIQQKTRGASDGAGGNVSETWSTYKELWAGIDQRSAREIVAADQTVRRMSAQIMVRYRTDLNSAMRILARKKRIAGETDKAFTDRGGQIFAIVGIRDLEEGGMRWTVLECEEGAPS